MPRALSRLRLVVVVLLLAIGCSSGGSDGAREATTAELESTTEPATTEEPATAAPAPPTAPPSLAGFQGSSTCTDPTPDVRFPNPGADLTEVDLVADGEAVTITWYTAGEVKPLEALEWRVETFAGVRYDHFFIVSAKGGEWRAVAIEQGTGGSEGVGEAKVIDGGLQARFPFSSIPEIEDPALTPPFTWAGLTSGGQINGDYCPDRATAIAEPSERATFK